MELTSGMKGYQELEVTEEITAQAMGSGTLPVFATPAMVALMESTCWKSVAEALPEGDGTVGTGLTITHDAPSPLGMKVHCISELTKVDGRALTFSVEVFDEKGLIGKGEHSRFIIHETPFLEKAKSRK